MAPPPPPPSSPRVVRRYLPDLLLLATFERLSVRRLLTIGGVSSRFLHLQKEALANRRMLTLFIGEMVSIKFFPSFSWLHSKETKLLRERQLHHSGLTVPVKLDSETVHWLVATFPKVSHCRLIYQCGTAISDELLTQMLTLLEAWAKKLSNLRLVIRTGGSDVPSPLVVRLLGFIAKQLLSLRTLTLDMNCFRPAETYTMDLSFIHRLKLFAGQINSYQFIGALSRSLGHQTETITEIRHFCEIGEEELQMMPLGIASNMTVMRVFLNSLPRNPLPQLMGLCSKYVNLKWLDIFADSLNLADCLAILSSLSHLARLQISVSRIKFSGLQVAREVPPLPLLPFASLEILCIDNACIYEHTLLPSFGPLERLFPRLNYLDVCLNTYCSDCTLTGLTDHPEERKKETFKLALSCLKSTLHQLMASSLTLRAEVWLRVHRRFPDYHRGNGAEIVYSEAFNFADGHPKEWQYNKKMEKVNGF